MNVWIGRIEANIRRLRRMRDWFLEHSDYQLYLDTRKEIIKWKERLLREKEKDY
jgi:hypothetical protein